MSQPASRPQATRPETGAPAPARPRFAPIKTRRIFEEICADIREQLISGQLKPGDRLPPERELAAMFSVSRTALREALRSLEIAGLITLRKGSKGGAFVLESSAALATQSIRNMMDLGRASLSALLEARMAVEEAVLKLACERASAADCEAIERNIDETEALTRAGRFEERTYTAIEFSTILARAAHNPVLSSIAESMTTVLRTFISIAGPQPHDPVVDARRRLLACVRAGDFAAASDTLRGYHGGLRRHLLQAPPAPGTPARPPKRPAS